MLLCALVELAEGKKLEHFPPQPGPSCDRPPLRRTRGLCRRGHGLRREPRVRTWIIQSIIIETCSSDICFHIQQTLHWSLKAHFDPWHKYLITRCASTFTEEEQDSLLDTVKKIATYECFLHFFEQVTFLFGRLVFDGVWNTDWGLLHIFSQSEDVLWCVHMWVMSGTHLFTNSTWWHQYCNDDLELTFSRAAWSSLSLLGF